jgi:hypothetical protein
MRKRCAGGVIGGRPTGKAPIAYEPAPWTAAVNALPADGVMTVERWSRMTHAERRDYQR